MKAFGLILAALGVGVAGYGGYRYYQQKKGLGNLTEGNADHNSKFAQAYWQRQAEIQQNVRGRQLNAIAEQRGV